MPIVGFNLDKILGEKKAEPKKGMRATHNITISSLKEEKISLGKTQKSGLKFEFEYSVKYEPNIGDLLITGHILYIEEEEQIKEILKEWQKSKKIKPELASKIINTAIVKSTIKALSLSQDLNLPPHLPIPVISPQRKEQDYIG